MEILIKLTWLNLTNYTDIEAGTGTYSGKTYRSQGEEDPTNEELGLFSAEVECLLNILMRFSELV